MSDQSPRKWDNRHHRDWLEAKERRRKRENARTLRMIAIPSALVFLGVLTWPFLGSGFQTSRQAIIALAAPNAVPAGRFECEVSKIVDGDTLHCSDGVKIRLHAVAARERDGSCTEGHPCPTASAEAATAELSRLASGKTLQCRQTGTSYDRVAAICWDRNETEINCAMVESGTAEL
jgi:endonuclease YncB( thermonuclease family)